MPAQSPFTVTCDNDQRQALERLTGSHSARRRRVQQAQAALAAVAAAEGSSNAVIARTYRLHIATVRR
ncbi:hypothetical protein [Streptomyces sp. NPDC004296]|uniref:hypothetical protein n=1 Tax=Streptomyces sp. NPDC004296 TaxID=3364697 RepID=UPI0036B2BCD6